MQEWVAADPSRTIRIFESFEEQDRETIRYWKAQPFGAKMRAIAEMAEAFSRQHGIDTDAQGPRRVTRRIQRARG